jgi:putative ABC transport system permease protein
MLKNYLLTTLRSLRRDWGYALINIAGLGIGVGCFMVLALYLASELTYDRHVPNHENIYRVAVELENDRRRDHVATTSRFMAPLLADDHAEVRGYVRFFPASQDGRLILRRDDVSFFWTDTYLTDPNVFELFGHTIVYGDPATALEDPLSIAISETVARRYFGDRNPIGEKLATDTAAYTVSLVFADLPVNTHLRYDVLLSYKRLDAFLDNVDIRQALWGLSDFSYLLMADGYNPGDFAEISESFSEKYLAERAAQLNASMRLYLEPLDELHLSSITEGDRPRGNMFYVYTFAAIAFFVLGIACINYMNLATARSIRRSKEVAMRKVVGASRGQLLVQFLGESLTFAVISVLLGLLLVHVVLRYTAIDSLLGTRIGLDLLEQPGLIVAALGLALLVGLVSGLYPAFYLAAIEPVVALRGSTGGKPASGGSMRQALVFLQFAISIGVISCTLLMAAQMRYLQTKPLGFIKDNIVVISLVGADLLERADFIKGELVRDPRILSATLTPNIPGEIVFTNLASIEADDGTESSQTVRVMGGDVDYLEVMGIEIIQGRPFDPATPNEQIAYVNETLVKKMGWTQPLGKHIDNGNFRNRVVGVVRDFHFQSLHTPVEPLYIFFNWFDFEGATPLQRAILQSYLYVKITSEDVPGTLALLEDMFNRLDPARPFEYRFLDDILDRQYASEHRQMQLIGIFAGVCIFISCMGLFGLSAFTTAQRTKEIGVRKILGASTSRIILTLFKDVVGLIVAALVVASAVSYYVVSNWLAGFAYKEGIGPTAFLTAGAFCLAVAFFTVALQSYRTARASPALALRYEG